MSSFLKIDFETQRRDRVSIAESIDNNAKRLRCRVIKSLTSPKVKTQYVFNSDDKVATILLQTA